MERLRERDGDEDDVSYALSEDVDTKKEKLESESDEAEIWLHDGDVPTCSKMMLLWMLDSLPR